MSKGNLFLGQARGAVGDVVFTRVDGEQVTHSRNRHPKNPQTAIQLLQRVLMKTNSLAYSMFSDIADHSFQGKQQGTPNQSEFTRMNIAFMRQELAQLINDNDPEEIMNAQDTNYAGKDNTLPVMRPYIMSDGNLAPIICDPQEFGIYIPNFSTLDWSTTPSGSGPSYNDLIAEMGLQRGDQLTFLFGYVDDTTEDASLVDFRFSRLILEPNDGDMTKSVFQPLNQGSPISVFNTTTGNDRNEGNIYIGGNGLIMGYGSDGEYGTSQARTLACFGVIVSRQNGGVWQRSRCQLSVRPNNGPAAMALDHESATLGDAIYSFLTAASSSLYLNQAENV